MRRCPCLTTNAAASTTPVPRTLTKVNRSGRLPESDVSCLPPGTTLSTLMDLVLRTAREEVGSFQPYALPATAQELVEQPHVFYLRQCTVGGHDVNGHAKLRSCVTPGCPHAVCTVHWKQTLRLSKLAFGSPWLCGSCPGQDGPEQQLDEGGEDTAPVGETEPSDNDDLPDNFELPAALSRSHVSCDDFPNIRSLFEAIETTQREIETAARVRLNALNDPAESRCIFLTRLGSVKSFLTCCGLSSPPIQYGARTSQTPAPPSLTFFPYTTPS